MKIILIVTLCMVLQPIIGAAQKTGNEKQHIRFHSINQVGVLVGSSDVALQLQTVNGVQYKTCFAGVGVGIDYYSVRSIPLFLALRKYIAFKKGSIYGYGDGGINYVWQRKYVNIQAMPTYDNGLYYDIGLGYRFPVNKFGALSLSAGFSEKRYAATSDQVNPCFNPPCSVSKQEFNYSLHRLSFKAGWIF